jgi:hypothetical protein
MDKTLITYLKDCQITNILNMHILWIILCYWQVTGFEIDDFLPILSMALNCAIFSENLFNFVFSGQLTL